MAIYFLYGFRKLCSEDKIWVTIKIKKHEQIESINNLISINNICKKLEQKSAVHLLLKKLYLIKILLHWMY